MFSAIPFLSSHTGQASVADVIWGGKDYRQCSSKAFASCNLYAGNAEGKQKRGKKGISQERKSFELATILHILPSFSFCLGFIDIVVSLYNLCMVTGKNLSSWEQIVFSEKNEAPVWSSVTKYLLQWGLGWGWAFKQSCSRGQAHTPDFPSFGRHTTLQVLRGVLASY